ncbi:MAG TPA: glycosyltransferase family 2 protein [Bdellovibrionota bacterium]|nr:glycosyltransferase family 2 protein [Bdellovibrionota bacterium]
MSERPPIPGGGLLIVVNYNQAQEIERYLEQARAYFPQDHCVIVDDGSTDGSREIAERMGFQVLRHPRNLGIGAAIRTGIKHALQGGYRWVLISASNGKMRPDEFAGVYGPVDRGEADYVQGNRFLREGSSPGLTSFRRAAIPAFSLLASMLLGRRFTDISCGLRCYTLELVRDPELDLEQPWLDRYELEYYLHWKAVRSGRYRVIEVPVTMKYDHIAKGRISKIKPIVGWWSMIRPFLVLSLRLKK